jgi:hypothetical protein
MVSSESEGFRRHDAENIWTQERYGNKGVEKYDDGNKGMDKYDDGNLGVEKYSVHGMGDTLRSSVTRNVLYIYQYYS